jgi:hypothetical protein
VSELEIQKWLRSGKSLDELKTTYGIGHRRHKDYANLVLFKYNQIASPFGAQIVRECRGIILNESDNWSVVARGFDKFFNHGEGHAAPIDWSTAKVQEKLDGSLCLVYWYDDAWHVATTGTPDASGDINGSGQVFADLFWQTLGTPPGEFPCSKSTIAFLFELMSPANRVVVVHEKPRLVLLGARIQDGRWLSAETARIYVGLEDDVEIVREFPLQSFTDIERSFAEMSPLKQEGYVIVDGAFNRVKVKHPGYVAMHHAKDGMSVKSFVDIARTGEVSEVISAFPELRPMLDGARARLTKCIEEIEAEYEVLRGIDMQKDFAAKATKSKFSGALFMLRAKKVDSAKAWIASIPIDKAVTLLGYKDAP